MKRPRNYPQLKEQDNSPEGANNEAKLCGLTDTEFKKDTEKILKKLTANMKELRVDMNSKIPSERN